MKSTPLLSVCIPTFNRVAHLRESLEVLLPQAKALGCEVCVSDNGCIDGTAAYLEDRARSFDCLRVVRQETNIGIDGNMMAVIGMASGKYVLPLGDDDFVETGALARILGLLDDDVDLLVLEGWHTDAHLSPMRLHLGPGRAGRVYVTPEAAFDALWNLMPFGSFLASRETYLLVSAGRYLGTSHAYAGVVWDALAQLHEQRGRVRVKCGEAPLVLIRGAEKTWRADAGVIRLSGIPHWLSLVAECSGYRTVALRIRAHYLGAQTTYHELFRMRMAGQLARANLDRLTAECDARQARRLRRVALIPPSLLKMLMSAAKSMRRPRVAPLR